MWTTVLNTLSPARRQRTRHAALIGWAEPRGLAFEPRRDGACAFTGAWSGHAVRIELQAAGRSYLEGQELNARADIGVPLPTGVVLMNRSLKRAMERWSAYVYSQITNSLETVAQDLPEEVRWLSTYRDAGWQGPGEAFFARYAVLTDSPEEARALIDPAVVQALMHWPDDARSPDTPLLLMRVRGKLQLRLQLEPTRHAGCERHALGLFELLSQRLLAQARDLSSRA
ncbi:hypothetical protein [Hydrogenophaga crocea]|uniref:Uncharacterized protein n=1 Tax=Hydrogenophaga crocea TaxID=2716225 RepID=A0A6G8IFL6_9BURK|nr:hypothetical protein [Hydrogenophaga crocea]QIM51770.1 hypothetical protein G9Q37_06250 [Hydrogenophaga crocea]